MTIQYQVVLNHFKKFIEYELGCSLGCENLLKSACYTTDFLKYHRTYLSTYVDIGWGMKCLLLKVNKFQ